MSKSSLFFMNQQDIITLILTAFFCLLCYICGGLHSDGTVRVKAFGPTPVLPLDVLMSVIHAASDATAYLQQAIAPIDATIRFLEPFGTANPPRSLEIESGSMGARLNHNHATQFMYVRQSLALWRLIMLNMMKLWSVADADMLSESNPHRLQNTGQVRFTARDSDKLSNFRRDYALYSIEI